MCLAAAAAERRLRKVARTLESAIPRNKLHTPDGVGKRGGVGGRSRRFLIGRWRSRGFSKDVHYIRKFRVWGSDERQHGTALTTAHGLDLKTIYTLATCVEVLLEALSLMFKCLCVFTKARGLGACNRLHFFESTSCGGSAGTFSIKYEIPS